jgi:hypothetical protein
MKRNLLFLLALIVSVASAQLHATVLLYENFNELTTGLPGLAITNVGAFHAIDGTNVDVVGPLGANNNAYWNYLCTGPETGSKCVDLNGSEQHVSGLNSAFTATGDPQAVLQTITAFTLTPGTNYYLSYDLLNSQRGLDAVAFVTLQTASEEVWRGSMNPAINANISNSPDYANYAYAAQYFLDDSHGTISPPVVVNNALITVTTPETVFLTFSSGVPSDAGELLSNVVFTSGTPYVPPTVPEPSSLMLLGTGLTAMAGWAHRKFAAR